ncbi:formyltransferase family protein [Methylosinus sp. LW4]|uniref:formyltransferase family protein n=1 Tax=Methylosinus sp. LW4 TaxID=136993 RepID=UPI000687010D|nr:formyltransferase family protein [Methylosinus sp. LW4]
MTILFLGPETSPLLSWIRQQEGDIIQTEEKITLEYIRTSDIKFIVSYGYRHILRKEMIEAVSGRVINLHISYLPWNRGADPNFWSFVDGTPKGVTIHYVDDGIDTGDIIAQKLIEFDTDVETLSTSYHRLQDEIQVLFKRHWSQIKSGACARQRQPVGGTSHRSRDKDPLSALLSKGWSTPVSALCEYAAEMQLSAQFFDTFDRETKPTPVAACLFA